MRWLTIGLAAALLTAACSSDGGTTDESDRTDQSADAGLVDESWWQERQDDYLAAAAQDFNPSNPLSAIVNAEAAARDDEVTRRGEDVTVDSLAEMFAEIDRFDDTTDFDVLYLLNLWYGYRDELPDETVAAIEQRLLDFKYWYTEPTPAGVVDDKYYWSENHRVIFHTDEYLAGQAFPDATFGNDGRTGGEHRDEARERILEWLDEKVRFGFTEWHSDVYYQKDITPLLSLVEWAEDEEVVTRAGMVLDLVLFDLAAHVQRGNFGATRGRSYMKDKSTALDQDTFGAAKLLFDDTDEDYPSTTDPGAVLLARAQNYRPPEVLRRIATSDETSVDRQRMGVALDPSAPVDPDVEAPHGYDFDDPENVAFWWERGAQTVWQVVPLTLDTLERHDLWTSQFFSAFEPLAATVGDDDELARELAHSLAPTLGFGFLGEIHSVTHRAPDVMLSTAQDHRPGVFADQQHSWQATLDEHAIVFTTAPSTEPEVGTEWPDSDGYWTGTGITPRSAQEGRAAIHLYTPTYEPGPPLPALGYLDYTHAYFPTEHFDEVVSDGNWTLARHGDGYVGLWSWRTPEWRDVPAGAFTHGLTEDFDLVAPGGPDNVWIVETGDSASSGSFEEFQRSLVEADIEVDERAPVDGLPGGFDVTYDSPAQGAMSFATDGPLVVDGDEVELHAEARMENPWATVPWEGRRYEITEGDSSLVLDFDSWTRTTT